MHWPSPAKHSASLIIQLTRDYLQHNTALLAIEVQRLFEFLIDQNSLEALFMEVFSALARKGAEGVELFIQCLKPFVLRKVVTHISYGNLQAMLKRLREDDLVISDTLLNIVDTLILNMDLSNFQENFLLMATENNLFRSAALMCSKTNDDFTTPVCKLLGNYM